MRVQVNGTSLFVDVEGTALEPDGYAMREKPTLLLLRPPGGVRPLGPLHPGHRGQPVLPPAALLHHRLTSPERQRHVGGGKATEPVWRAPAMNPP